jgi:hypothetical protein
MPISGQIVFNGLRGRIRGVLLSRQLRVGLASSASGLLVAFDGVCGVAPGRPPERAVERDRVGEASRFRMLEPEVDTTGLSSVESTPPALVPSAISLKRRRRLRAGSRLDAPLVVTAGRARARAWRAVISLHGVGDVDRKLVAGHASLVVPSYVTHYHLAGRAPFLNLSDLSLAELEEVFAGLERDRELSGSRRVFGKRYMELRQRTEARLRELFVAAGGKPQRASPHYFVLGSSRWFESLAATTRRVVVDLTRMPVEATSCTYPDSFTAMGFGSDYGLPSAPQPYHGRVFFLTDLPALMARYGLPDDLPDADYVGYQQRPFEKYIEVQLWSDEPVRAIVAESMRPG